MRKKKIAVIGKGTAGSQAVAHLYRHFPEAEIFWHFDPNKPAWAVGEGSQTQLPKNLFRNIGFTTQDLIKINGTLKTGILKENWGPSGEQFFHNFPNGSVGYHFSATELQNQIYSMVKDRVEIVEGETNYMDLDVDFVMNASGKPSSLKNFYVSDYIPVNSAYVTQCYWDFPKFNHTLTIAGRHGWVFGIPLQNRCSIGYVYNKKISSIDEIKIELEEIFNKYGLTPSSTTSEVSFASYYRPDTFEERVVHNGNSSFFLEPLEATSIASMDFIQKTAVNVWNGNDSVSQANKHFVNLMDQIELMIMLHYASGSRFKTPFWECAQEKGIKKLESKASDQHFRSMYEAVKKFRNFRDIRFAPGIDEIGEYGTWPAASYIENLNGLKLFDTIEKIFK